MPDKKAADKSLAEQAITPPQPAPAETQPGQEGHDPDAEPKPDEDLTVAGVTKDDPYYVEKEPQVITREDTGEPK